MSKGLDAKKTAKKKPAKSADEKRAMKKAKKAGPGFPASGTPLGSAARRGGLPGGARVRPGCRQGTQVSTA